MEEEEEMSMVEEEGSCPSRFIVDYNIRCPSIRRGELACRKWKQPGARNYATPGPPRMTTIPRARHEIPSSFANPANHAPSIVVTSFSFLAPLPLCPRLPFASLMTRLTWHSISRQHRVILIIVAVIV